MHVGAIKTSGQRPSMGSCGSNKLLLFILACIHTSANPPTLRTLPCDLFQPMRHWQNGTRRTLRVLTQEGLPVLAAV